MTRIEEQLKIEISKVGNTLYHYDILLSQIKIDKTPPEFAGELTIIIFPFVKLSKKSPEQTAQEMGAALQSSNSNIESFNVVKGFLNLSFKDQFWIQQCLQISKDKIHNLPHTGKKIAIEYGGPNTNKPLHLGHVRNMLLGSAVANILEAAGNEVIRVNIMNDRGIAICKSMIAYMQTGNHKTPTSENMKGDHFVGKYYVAYAQIYEVQVAELISQGVPQEEAKKNAPIYLGAVDLLQKWEAHDPPTLALWNTMNDWVYEGFNVTYKNIGIHFIKEYKESDYYLKGKEYVLEGLKQNIFFKKEDGSIWVDLKSDGLDEKVLLRKDGTSVYITQDIGVAYARYLDFKMDSLIYTVANEQDYHFKVLKLILQKLKEPYADKIFHLSYGMVDLPEGKMKSREGTVIDADDLIDTMKSDVKEFLESSDKKIELDEEAKMNLYNQIGLGALKYFILKVDPKKRILFNPKESIDLHGNTGPFIQYTYARIQSIFRKLEATQFLPKEIEFKHLFQEEKELIVLAYNYPVVIQNAANNFAPSEIANYLYSIAKTFNKFYDKHSITKAESEEKLHLRALLALHISNILKHGLNLLGIESPSKM